MTSGDLEEVLQQNLVLRHELAIEVAKAVEPVPFKWWRERFERSEDQPLFFALLVVLIAITLYVFLSASL
jgi:hypothetical protein